jgi:hypothetical protein
VAGHQLLDVLGEVVPQVPAVGDLDRNRCALAGAVGVGAGAVPADDLGAGMLAQPVGEGVGFPVGKQVHRAVAVDVDQDGAVAVAAAQREVVDAEHGHAAGIGVGQRAEQAQQGAAAGRQPKACRPAARRRGRPAPGRWPPASGGPGDCGGRTGWSGRGPARRRCAPGRRGGGRRTDGPAAGPPRAGRRSPRRPACARSGCGPWPRSGRTAGTWRVGRVGWPRSARRRRPARPGRWLRPPGAEGGRRELGVHMPRMAACPATDSGSV